MIAPEVETAIIPLAGLATRMQPLARTVPKEMLPLGDRPLLHLVVEELVNGGVRHIVFVVGPRSEAIERYFHHLPDLDGADEARSKDPIWAKTAQCSFSFVRQDEPCGVLDAVRRAYWMVRDDRPYIVHMGDSIIWHDSGLIKRMISCHRETSSDATFAVGWRLPHYDTHSVAEPIDEAAPADLAFEVRQTSRLQQQESKRAPFVLGRYLLNGPMPPRGELLMQVNRFGGLTPLMHNGESASVMAVPLIGRERLLGAGTLGEYHASWRQWLAERMA